MLSGAWQVRLFSRKNDNMTFKYPDVVAAVRAAQRSDRAFVLDAEIVPVVSPAAAAGGSGALAAAAGAPAGAAEKPEVEVRGPQSAFQFHYQRLAPEVEPRLHRMELRRLRRDRQTGHQTLPGYHRSSNQRRSHFQHGLGWR